MMQRPQEPTRNFSQSCADCLSSWLTGLQRSARSLLAHGFQALPTSAFAYTRSLCVFGRQHATASPTAASYPKSTLKKERWLACARSVEECMYLAIL